MAILVIELKAVKHLSGENMEQLYYYMAHLRCNVGYLINFPHETGFPNVLDVGIATGALLLVATLLLLHIPIRILILIPILILLYTIKGIM